MLEKSLNDGLLVPVSELELSIGEEALIYAILTPNGAKRPSIKAKLKKFDSKIYIELLDPSLLHTKEEEEEPPIRELLVTAKICRSVMNLAQKNINFGDIRLDDHKAKTLVIHNESEVSKGCFWGVMNRYLLCIRYVKQVRWLHLILRYRKRIELVLFVHIVVEYIFPPKTCIDFSRKSIFSLNLH